MRRFHLQRNVDVSGVSGTGKVAEGVVFENGKVALSWLTQYTSVSIYDDVDTMQNICGHGGKTLIVWDDLPGAVETTPPVKVREAEDNCA